MNRVPAVALAALGCAACGYIGPPLPPALKLPNRVIDLAAVQRGSSLVITFSIPKLTTEGMPIEDPPETDLRVGVSGAQFHTDQWAENARQIPARPDQAVFIVAAAEFAGHDVVVGVRLRNDRGRDAGWSNFVTLPVTAPLAKPAEVSARATANGVELRWQPSDAPLFRVFRKDEATDFAAIGDTPTSSYVDVNAAFGKPYSYYVQALRKTGDVFTESEVSDTVSITPEDRFSPAVPVHVSAIAGTRSIELSWDRDTEPDLAGYRVFRAEGDGSFSLLAEKLAAPNYSDRDVKPGTRYRYAISAVDVSRNESERSEPVTVQLP